MKTIQQNIERRNVIEAYAKYDCPKKNRPLPEFATWDWSSADAIDREMTTAHLKQGVPAGYLLWDKVELTIDDLRQCAVAGHIFPRKSRDLGQLEDAGELVNWEPKPRGAWYEGILEGRALDENTPLLLRPAVCGEFPAIWYIEDGSGRAISVVANQHRYSPTQTVAVGYLGAQSDKRSRFMQQKFRELCDR